MTNLIGQTLDKYYIEKELGRGGMGIVYRCRHIHLDRLQAIKVMHDSLVLDSSFQARFLQEAQSISRLDHANIVKLYDFDSRDGRYYITMELLEDGSLRALLDRRKRESQVWPLPFGLGLVRQAAEALAYAHAHGIIHRDIKPDNLLVMRQRTPDGRSSYTVKVSDFGLVRLAEGSGLTSLGKTVGTPAYMSPEQCQGLPLDGRSDIYSLGVVLYEVMTGYLPFNTQSPSDAIQKHVFTPAPSPRTVRPDLPKDVEEVILRCLEKAPDKRFSDASEMAAALRELMRAYSAGPISTPATDTGARHVTVANAAGEVIQRLDLVDGVLTVGRLPDNDIVLDEPSISRKHARIEWNGKRAKVADLATKLGTLLNGEPVRPDAPQLWQVGQKLKIGSYTLDLLIGGANTVTVTIPPEMRQITLTPGELVHIPVNVRQLAKEVETFLVVVDEWPAYWIATPVAPIVVPPGGEATTTLSLQVPPQAIRESASFRVMIRVIAVEHPDRGDVTAAVWRVDVPKRPRVELALDPASQQARDQARYTVRVANVGSQPAEVLLSVEDERRQIAFNLEQSRLKLEPNTSADVGLQVRTSGGRWLGGARSMAFTVTAQVTGGDPVAQTGEFVQTSILPI